MKGVVTLLVAALIGCSASAPEKPTWVGDVQPIMMANCVRCHGSPATGGAPDSYRLDVYQDTVADGRVVLGAAAMARWVCLRMQGALPASYGGVSQRSREILVSWFDGTCRRVNVEAPPQRGSREPNAAPTVTINTGNGKGDDSLEVEYLVKDADREAVTGQLLLGEVVADPGCKAGGGRTDHAPLDVHGGAGHLSFDTGTLCAGLYALSARISDGTPGAEVARALGMVSVVHPGGNLAPRVELVRPARDALLNAKVAPIVVEFTVHDGDGDYPVVYRVTAVRGREHLDVTPAAPTAGLPGQPIVVPLNVQVTIDPTLLADDPSWRFEVTVTDARGAVRLAASDEVVVSSIDPASVELRFDGAGRILRGCDNCHGGLLATPGLQLDVLQYDSLTAHLGQLYRRVVQRPEMPPPSTLQAIGVTAEMALPDADREALGRWLLVGAPRD